MTTAKILAIDCAFIHYSAFTCTEDILNTCPDGTTDQLVTHIIANTQNMDRCLFGCYLGIPRDEVLALQNGEDRGHSAIMIKIFDCWNRKTVEKTWRCILQALENVGFTMLASKIEKELFKTLT